MVPGGKRNGLEPVVIECMFRVLANRVGQFGEYSGTKFVHIDFDFSGKRFLRHLKPSMRKKTFAGAISLDRSTGGGRPGSRKLLAEMARTAIEPLASAGIIARPLL